MMCRRLSRTPNDMRILGIDPGVERVGIAVIDKVAGKEAYVFSECFKTSAKLSHAERLALIGAETARVIAEHAPEALAIEKLFFEKNTTTAMFVAEARGVIMYECARQGLKVYEYTPMEIKVAVTGYTDNTGNDAINIPLSGNRATSVANYLEAQGVPAGEITAKGMGAASPVAGNDTDAGRAKNRRVEIAVS